VRSAVSGRLEDVLAAESTRTLLARVVEGTHARLMRVLEGDGVADGVTVEDGEVHLNLLPLVGLGLHEVQALGYLEGVEVPELAAGGDPAKVASVASFFVSRVDSAVDGLLPSGSELAGKAAVANAKVVYERFQFLFGDLFAELAQAGARPQRLLWASTGTKNPAYPDTLYIDELIGPDTVNTMPPATMEAFRDHGRVAETLTQEVGEAHQLLADLAAHGIDLQAITEELQTDGVAAFVQSFETLTAAIAGKRGE
jgi:transaldolase